MLLVIHLVKWTDNTNLIFNSTLLWENNDYHEAFSQEADDNNPLALKIVPFPASGGVVLTSSTNSAKATPLGTSA